MAKQDYTFEQSIVNCGKQKVLPSQGKDIAEVSKHLCGSEQTYYC